MRITINIYGGGGGGQTESLLNLEVFPEMTVGALRDSIQAETSIPQASIAIYHDGFPLSDDSKTMEQLRMTDGEMLLVYARNANTSHRPQNNPPRQVAPRQQQQQQQQQPPPQQQRSRGRDPELIRLNILSNPALRQQLQQMNPQMAAALDNPQEFARIFDESVSREQRERDARQREIEQLNADPFDIEAQARIEEMIRQERVMENLQNAMEHNPEVFGRVHMLYLEVEVNGYKVKALVDSGAQETIMSPSCAEACGIMRLVDRRFAGIARGVGTAKIIGKVHAAHIKIGTLHLPCSFTVMEGKSVEMLLGLDMLKRYQACIDLAKDKLIIQGEEVPFLGAADIPKELEEAVIEEPRVPAPSRTSISQPSGAAPPTQQPSNEASLAPVVSGPTSAAPSGSTSAATSTPQAAITEQEPSAQKIEQLMAMGASRETAINALQAAEGNVEVAAGFIFFGS